MENGLVQDCSICIANALEILQSCIKPYICDLYIEISYTSNALEILQSCIKPYICDLYIEISYTSKVILLYIERAYWLLCTASQQCIWSKHDILLWVLKEASNIKYECAMVQNITENKSQISWANLLHLVCVITWWYNMIQSSVIKTWSKLSWYYGGKNIYRSDLQDTFEFDSHFRCLQITCPLFQKKNKFTKYCVTWALKSTK